MPTIIIRKKQGGFSLMDVLSTLAIMGVLLALVTPSVVSTLDKQRLRGACNDVYGQLMLGMSEAVKRNNKVSVVFRNTPFALDADGDGQAERYAWCMGWYETGINNCDCGSPDSSTQCRVGGRVQTVRYLQNDAVVVGSTDVTFSGRRYTTFNPHENTASAGSVQVNSKQWACKITLSSLARVRFNQTTDGRRIVPLEQKRLLTR